MSQDNKVVVSKRNGRPYVDCDMDEKNSEDYQEKRSAQQGETGSDNRDRQSSTSTATSHSSQSSLESSPLIQPAKGQENVDSLVLGPHGLHHNDSPLALLPPAPLKLNLAHGATELEYSLPPGVRPTNFGIVVPGIYRSSFPQSEDYDFIERLKIKTIVTLVQKDFPQGYGTFLHKNGIKHAVFDMKGTKKEAIPLATMKSILRVVLDRRNHPLLIHCNHGKHRTGCVVGIVRKLSGWDLGNIITEYKSYAAPKVRECDIEYITGFELAHISNLFRSDWPFRTVRFLRAAAFSLAMLVIWFVSGTRVARDGIVMASERELLSED